MRYVIKFNKASEIKFVAHLDLMRTIQRGIRRAKLPAEYSKGFNPHMTLSLAQPLPVGIYSEGEYADIVMTEEIEENIIKEKFNEFSPVGIKIEKVIKVPQVENAKKVPQVMALIDAADYMMRITYKDNAEIEKSIEGLLNKESWNTMKKTKSGEKEVNIKPLVKKIEYRIEENILELKVLVSCGSRENLSAELLGEFIKNNSNDVKENTFIQIFRKEMYVKQDEDYVPLYKYFIS